MHSEDSDQTGLIWVFARRTGYLVGFVMLRLQYLTKQMESKNKIQIRRLSKKQSDKQAITGKINDS